MECVSRLCHTLVLLRIQKRDKNIYLPCIGWMLLDAAVLVGVVVDG
jgi:hypothetical protein